ncbi:hypothetical protein [Noviherbaspirillum massiliense]|uniref:COG4648 family protein n=1 Tax=Noviherbaspirillum massiliense TaxID=1465823 RepID=UPI0002D945DF|nr:hypothetical protein [Noviherbaspirillum massiliense]
MSQVFRSGRWIAGMTLAVAYALLAHYTNIAQTETLGTAVALAPIVLAALSMAWHARHRGVMLFLFLLACVALLLAWHPLEHHFNQIYWMEHAGTQLFLCTLFGRTLGPGREPLCTSFAKTVHGPLTPALERYTRQVTKAWVVFFSLMSATSTAIFFLASLSTWSAFANFFTAPLIGLMFVGEYLVRRRRHPHMRHAHILDGVKAFWKASAG